MQNFSLQDWSDAYRWQIRRQRLLLVELLRKLAKTVYVAADRGRALEVPSPAKIFDLSTTGRLSDIQIFPLVRLL